MGHSDLDCFWRAPSKWERNRFLQKSAVFCGFLRKSAVFCGFLRFSATPKSLDLQSEPKICENVRSGSGFSLWLSPQRALRDRLMSRGKKKTRHKLATIFDSQLPSPKLSLKMTPKLTRKLPRKLTPNCLSNVSPIVSQIDSHPTNACLHCGNYQFDLHASRLTLLHYLEEDNIGVLITSFSVNIFYPRTLLPPGLFSACMFWVTHPGMQISFLLLYARTFSFVSIHICLQLLSIKYLCKCSPCHQLRRLRHMRDTPEGMAELYWIATSDTRSERSHQHSLRSSSDLKVAWQSYSRDQLRRPEMTIHINIP